MKGLITLEEWNTVATLKDVMDANEALDIMEEQEEFYQERARQEARARR